MEILLIAHPYLNLYKCIVKELMEQGHVVTVIEETNISGDPYYKKQNKLKRRFLIWKWEKDNKSQNYWIKRISDPIFNKKYDLLFVIQGCTFDPFLLMHLKKYNPKLKSSLYIWDSNEMYDFFRNIQYFDKVYSFDKRDVEIYGQNKVKFLPFFWDKCLINLDNIKPIYKISSIGTEHHGRYHIYKKVIETLKDKSISHYIKIILPTKNQISFRDRFHYFINVILNKSKEIELYKIRYGFKQCFFRENKYYSPDELYNIIAQSESILDTDNENQYGTTPRLIWALALNKHIYTTNTNIINFPFYNKKYIHIINRQNPQIDFNYINIKNMQSRKTIEYLRIDNWIHYFID